MVVEELIKKKKFRKVKTINSKLKYKTIHHIFRN
jgi:hypothetical protein